MLHPSSLLLLLFLQLANSLRTPLPIPDSEPLLAFKSKADLSNKLHFPRTRHNSTYFCNWPGVQCNPQSRITRLVLEGLQLNGTFAAGTLDRLDQLRILSLQNNSLCGPIPDLSPLTNLKALFLDHNLFTGSFPPSIFSLHRLRTLDLSHNNLDGQIPVKILALDRLYYLRLNSNRFNGSIPPLNQSSLKIFNVSKNELTGAVPVTDTIRRFEASVFSGNPGLCGQAVRRECGSHLFFFHGNGSSAPAPAAPREVQIDDGGILLPDSSSSYKKLHKRGFLVIGLLAAAFLVIVLVGVSIVLKKKKRNRDMMMSQDKNQEILGMERNDSRGNNVNAIEEVENSNSEMVAAAAAMSEEKVKKMGRSGSLVFCAGEAQVYTLEQLMRGSAEMLGRGNVGSTYKAVLDNRLIVSVKRIDATKMGATGKEVFERHMEAVGRLRHPNLVPLRAYFQAKEERLIVYDYQPNGSLYSLIHGSRSTRAKPLHWTSCLKIAEDIAQGLAYIHQASRLVHGNLKSSNVLLGADFEACLTDNCLLSLIEPPPFDGNQEDSGYRSPETQKSNHKLTPRSDIYAFGILILELLTGKPPLHQNELISIELPTWVRSVREDEGSDDERLMMIVDIAAACVQYSPESRPTTWQVLKMIQEVKTADTEGNNDNDSSIIP